MQTTATEQFYYEPSINSPKGYPVEVYRGGLETATGGFESLCLGADTGEGGWGSTGGGMSSGIKTVPNRLNLIWLSYAEDCMYEIDCPIDDAKMIHYFKEGFQNSGTFFNRNGLYKKITYEHIVVGFAPGGAVFVWLNGGDKAVEIGRYQGKKTTVPQAEIDKLDNHDRLLFDPVDRKRTMENPNYIPLEMQKANKNKPIPLGLWDTYRDKYSWRPTIVVQREGSAFDIRMEMYNGEIETFFDKTLVKNEYSNRAIPKRVNIGWRDKTGQNYSGTMDFDEKEIFDAFAVILKDKKDGQAELEFNMNIPNTFITVQLKGNGKTVNLNEKTKVDIFEADTKY